MRKWEYMTLVSKVRFSDIEDLLNHVGEDGWELVAKEGNVSEEPGYHTVLFIFKREMDQNVPQH